MNPPIIKAFVLCTEITDTPGSSEQKDLRGAGLGIIRYSGAYPFKFNFWCISKSQPEEGQAESSSLLYVPIPGEDVSFPDVSVSPTDPLELLRVGI
jgi:hypothetical protein